MNRGRNTVRAETDYTYTDKSSGKPLSFTPKPDEMMVTFQETPSEATLNDVIQATPLLSVSQGYDLDYGFAAVYVSPHPGAEAAVRSVVHRPEIANSLPVMIDQEGLTRYFLPDEFTVQFLEGVSKGQAEHIISRQGEPYHSRAADPRLLHAGRSREKRVVRNHTRVLEPGGGDFR